jgi:putative addiction module component (TIGR02574 family)
MDLTSTLAEIVALNVEDRLRLVEAIWDSIAAEPSQLELTEAQKTELQRRLDRHAAFPQEGTPWAEVKAEALARIRR